MSLTATLKGQPCETGSIILSPSKRPRRDVESNARTTHELVELWKWTFTRKAIASCFIEDVLNMKDNMEKASNFFWLGRVPCRSVRIVGLVVGIQVYERCIRYTVDDGTAVIDCRQQLRPPPTSVKRKPETEAETTTKRKELPSPMVPKFVARVGLPVCVVGRVIPRFQTREIVVDSMERCTSPNDEPLHWLEVHRLHKEYYSLSIPFQIPQTVESAPSSPVKQPAIKGSTTLQPTTPSTVLFTPSTACSTSSRSNHSSPSKPVTAKLSIKLRHPSRLHSRDLTSNTFRIYVKHYMDRIVQMNLSSDLDPDSDTGSFIYNPSTPTKHSRHAASDKTPRPMLTLPKPCLLTPRPYIAPLSFNIQSSAGPSSIKVDNPRLAGFTLSYLRRVPELADMAKRVVKAVAKRRHREERKKLKEAVISSGSTRHLKHTTTNTQADEPDKTAPRVKRLFQSTIVQLVQDGSIILWDGPVLPLPRRLAESAGDLWKSSMVSMSADVSVFSVASVSLAGEEEEDELPLSEPDSNEEVFMPLTPQFLAGVVESAIGKLVIRAREGSKGDGGYRAATKERILGYLKRDDRWRCLSEWSVDEALSILRTEGRAWCVGEETWELSI